MQQMAGQMGIFNPMALQFGAYGAYAQARDLTESTLGSNHHPPVSSRLKFMNLALCFCTKPHTNSVYRIVLVWLQGQTLHRFNTITGVSANKEPSAF